MFYRLFFLICLDYFGYINIFIVLNYAEYFGNRLFEISGNSIVEIFGFFWKKIDLEHWKGIYEAVNEC